jgi:nitroreductase
MDVYTAVRLRRSVRNYLDKPVEEEKLDRILEAARLAPSASNRQEWRLVVVRDPAMRQKLAEAANNQKFVGQAGAVLVACANKAEHVMSCGQPCYPIDVAIILDHISLLAAAEGLGTCWIGAFNEAKVKQLLNIPAEARVVELMPIGYPAEPLEAKPKNRLAVGEIVKEEVW